MKTLTFANAGAMYGNIGHMTWKTTFEVYPFLKMHVFPGTWSQKKDEGPVQLSIELLPWHMTKDCCHCYC